SFLSFIRGFFILGVVMEGLIANTMALDVPLDLKEQLVSFYNDPEINISNIYLTQKTGIRYYFTLTFSKADEDGHTCYSLVYVSDSGKIFRERYIKLPIEFLSKLNACNVPDVVAAETLFYAEFVANSFLAKFTGARVERISELYAYMELSVAEDFIFANGRSSKFMYMKIDILEVKKRNGL
ncbi:MAG: hypothetical protein ACRCUJ_05600, partial [Phocaeicola sp.]